jgi:PAS domain S-box-containing protein
MSAPAPARNLLQTRSGEVFLVYLVFCLIIAAGVGYGFYAASLSWFEAHKSEEKITVLRLVDAFVQNYSDIRAKVGGQAPVPATFRAHSIELFNKIGGDAADFRLRWVGREHRSITTPPTDPQMAETIESFAARPKPKPVSSFLTVDGDLVLRTVYPSFAGQQSCVDCHNGIQPDQHWKLGDLMGAFAIDVPAGPAFRSSFLQAASLAAALFLVLAAVGYVFALFHRRQTAEREVAQGSLRLSESRFRDFAATASDWFWEQDEQFRFVYTSQGAPGDSADDVTGMTRRDLVLSGANFGVTEEQLRAHEADLEAHRPFQNMRFQRLLADGRICHISVSGRPVFDASGTFRGYRGTGRDVTSEVEAEIELGLRVEERTAELRKAQGELVRKEKLSTLGQLTATVAHELRNPLSAIRNTIFAVKESLARANIGIDVERPLSRVERNIQRCDRIISDLLDFTRMRELACSEVEADAWLDELLNEQRLPEGVTLNRAFATDRHRVSFDTDQMRRVVINIVENAAQAVAQGASADPVVTVRTRATAAWFELAVEDTGPGIPPDVLPRVFEPLFSTKSFGTGLGLPTVKQIVEQHGGTVEISSQPGQGTRVVVRLPSAMAEELAA